MCGNFEIPVKSETSLINDPETLIIELLTLISKGGGTFRKIMPSKVLYGFQCTHELLMILKKLPCSDGSVRYPFECQATSQASGNFEVRFKNNELIVHWTITRFE